MEWLKKDGRLGRYETYGGVHVKEYGPSREGLNGLFDDESKHLTKFTIKTFLKKTRALQCQKIKSQISGDKYNKVIMSWLIWW